MNAASFMVARFTEVRYCGNACLSIYWYLYEESSLHSVRSHLVSAQANSTQKVPEMRVAVLEQKTSDIRRE